MKAKQLILTIGCVLFLAATLVVNFLANALPINGKSTGELSDNISNLFVPAGITFAVWGVIYLLLLLFVIYLIVLLVMKNPPELPFLNKVQGLFIISSIANIGWIFAWHYEQILLSFVIMLVLLACLLMLYLQIRKKSHFNELSLRDHFFVSLPFSVYLGWITVATIANATAVLVTFKWDGFGLSETFWTIAMLVIAAVVGLLVLLREKDIAYNGVLIWAFLGIVIKRTDPAYTSNIPVVATAWAVLGVLAAGIIGLIVFRMIWQKP
ncbi:MAG: tryptophan-rich sensory protein [Spirochaetales bacterium]|nr:tryptophan-rich sensory protein [Spirochaetales bacterium]